MRPTASDESFMVGAIAGALFLSCTMWLLAVDALAIPSPGIDALGPVGAPLMGLLIGGLMGGVLNSTVGKFFEGSPPQVS